MVEKIFTEDESDILANFWSCTYILGMRFKAFMLDTVWRLTEISKQFSISNNNSTITISLLVLFTLLGRSKYQIHSKYWFIWLIYA